MVDVASPELEVAAGLELLDSSDVLIVDITNDLVLTGSQVSRRNRARIHGTCRLVLSRAINWHNQRLRPYVTLTDLDSASQRYDLGIYLPETPTRTAGESPQTYVVEGYDKLVILATPHGSTFEAAAGDGYVATVEALLSGEAFTIDQTAASETLPSTKVWPIDEATSTLSIINELLASINYRSLYADRAGRFTSEVWESPTTRSPVYAYDTAAAETILFDGMAEETDLFDVPNRWVFIRDDPAQALPSEGSGIYTTVNQSDGITSIDERGRTITRIVRMDAVDQATLVTRGDLIAAADREPSTSIKFSSGPNPVHWHAETVSLTAAELGYSATPFTELGWMLPLDGGAMTHEARRA